MAGDSNPHERPSRVGSEIMTEGNITITVHNVPALCSHCGEIFDERQATTMVAFISGGKLTAVWCMGCFIEKMSAHMQDKIEEVMGDLA